MNHIDSQCYAIIPAAGQSRRMGRPKLLLPWPGKDQPAATIIDRVLDAWTESRTIQVVIVVRPGDVALSKACQQWPVDIVQPDFPPVDMKASVQIGLEFLEKQFQPGRLDRVFVAPADLPTLSGAVIDRLAKAPVDEHSIVVPVFGEVQGHPILIPWPLTGRVAELREDEGINSLVERLPKQLIHFEAKDRITDVDTPDDYDSARRGHVEG